MRVADVQTVQNIRCRAVKINFSFAATIDRKRYLMRDPPSLFGPAWLFPVYNYVLLGEYELAAPYLYLWPNSALSYSFKIISTEPEILRANPAYAAY